MEYHFFRQHGRKTPAHLLGSRPGHRGPALLALFFLELMPEGQNRGSVYVLMKAYPGIVQQSSTIHKFPLREHRSDPSNHQSFPFYPHRWGLRNLIQDTQSNRRLFAGPEPRSIGPVTPQLMARSSGSTPTFAVRSTKILFSINTVFNSCIFGLMYDANSRQRSSKPTGRS
jgi:hypothetical protein